MDGRAPIADIAGAGAGRRRGRRLDAVDRLPSLSCAIPSPWRRWRCGATRRIKVALMAMSPYSMHPVFIAMAAASLDEMYPGRVILCLGVGRAGRSQGGRHRVAQAAGRDRRGGEDLPLAARRRDGRLPGPGVQGLRPAAGQWRPRNVPIVLAASRPNMLQLAGRADRRRADLGRDLAALREGLPRRGGVRRRPAVPQARHRLHQARRHGEARHRSDPPADRLRAARRPSCREHPPVRRRASTRRRWRPPMPPRTGARSTAW